MMHTITNPLKRNRIERPPNFQNVHNLPDLNLEFHLSSFSEKKHVFSYKIDGHRAMFHLQSRTLFSKTLKQIPLPDRFELDLSNLSIPEELVEYDVFFDGELYIHVEDANKHPGAEFELMTSVLRTPVQNVDTGLWKRVKLCAFDILLRPKTEAVDPLQCTSQPLGERLALLEQCFQPSGQDGFVVKVDYYEFNASLHDYLVQNSKDRGYEGIVVRSLESTYYDKDSMMKSRWCLEAQAMVVYIRETCTTRTLYLTVNDKKEGSRDFVVACPNTVKNVPQVGTWISFQYSRKTGLGKYLNPKYKGLSTKHMDVQ